MNIDTSKLIAYYKKCYESDGRGQEISDVFSSKYKHFYVFPETLEMKVEHQISNDQFGKTHLLKRRRYIKTIIDFWAKKIEVS